MKKKIDANCAIVGTMELLNTTGVLILDVCTLKMLLRMFLLLKSEIDSFG